MRRAPDRVRVSSYTSPLMKMAGGDPANSRRDGLLPRLKRQTLRKSPGISRVFRNCIAPRPAQKPGPVVDPAILRRHLGHARGAEAEIAENEADGRVDRIVSRRQQCALEQRKMDEPHGQPKD